MDESFLLEQLVRSMGDSFECSDSTGKGGATTDDIDNMLAQLAVQVPLVFSTTLVLGKTTQNKHKCLCILTVFLFLVFRKVPHIHNKVCEVLQKKYTSILSSDDMTAGLGSEVIGQFCRMKPLFEQLEKVGINFCPCIL